MEPSVKKSALVRRAVSSPANGVVVEIADFRRSASADDFRSTPPPRSYPFRKPHLGLVILIIATFVLSRQLVTQSARERIAIPVPPTGILESLPVAADLGESSRAEVAVYPRKKETAAAALKRYGLSGEILTKAPGEISRLNISLDEVTAGGKRMIVGLSPQGDTADLRTKLNSGEELLLTATRRGVDARLVTPIVPFSDKVVLGTIEGSFASDAVRAGMSAAMIDDFADLFSGRLEFRRDLRKGDRFTIIFGNSSDPQKGRGVDGTILAAAVESGGKNFVAIRYVGVDGKSRYFDEKGDLIGNTFLRYPLKFSRISSYYSDSRLHPVLQRRRPHLGVDFAAPTGTPVRSVAAGRVVFAGYKGPSGNMVQIRHNERYTTTYLHLSRISPGLSKGRSVARGEVIGGVGCTGLCTGPHLHYGFFDRGKYVDPLKLKLPTEENLRPGLAVNRNFLERVLFTVEHYQGMNPKNFS